MKKIFILILLIVTSFNLAGRTLTSNEVWSGTHTETVDVYVQDGWTLTIDPGTIVQFASGKSLIVTGTGILLAGSLTGSSVKFTAENGTSWGHILIENSPTSYLRNCEIEKGDATGFSPAFGGGVHINTSSLSIDNCVIHNNIAAWGGGIFVNSSVSPSISNCTFYLNTATEGGGGMYFWDSSNSLVTNCIVYRNSVTGFSYGGGGIFIGPYSGNLKIINCVIANNNAVNSNGPEVYLFASPYASIINSIIWGSTNPVYFNSTSTNVMKYCGIQGTLYSTCLNLNSSNTDIAGPNFYNFNSGSEDYRIYFKSPCRDAGSTPSPTVDNDNIGNFRIGPYDIGAYEVQYSRWKTTASSTDWNTSTNWEANVDPETGTGDVYIPFISGANPNYPVGTPPPDFTINTDRQMILKPGAKVTLGSLTNDGTLKLESDESNISSLIIGSYSGNDADVELYLTGGGTTETYKWHYISSPISSLPVNTFILKTTMDFAQFFEARPTTDIGMGWIAYDGYIYFGGGYLTGLPYVISGTNLNVGQGYNYYYSSDYKFSFAGQLNVSSVSPTITYGGNPTLHGFNLLGNPFSSGLNWTTIITDPGFPSSTTSKGLYFTRNNTQCSYIGGVGYPDVTVTGIIPPMQGFFIHTTSTSTTLPLLAGARAHNIPARYKGEEIIPLVRLQLDNDILKDNTVIRFDTKASAVLDNDFDAVRMFLNSASPYIYSSDGIDKYAINGQPFPEQFIEIPLTLNVTQDGSHTLTATQLQGLDSYNVDLLDNVTDFTVRLNTNPVLTFSSSTGLFTDRFILKISNVATAVENLKVSDNTFNIYHGFDLINIQTIADEWDGKSGSVKVLDLTGKTITNLNDAEFSKNSLIQVQAPDTKGLYVVEIRSGAKRYVGKVVVK
jgi:parallel beta-helix repeat protein